MLIIWSTCLQSSSSVTAWINKYLLLKEFQPQLAGVWGQKQSDVCLYFGAKQHHSDKVRTRQERRHLIVRKCRDCLCILNPGGQSCCSRHSFSGFIVLDLFTYLFSLGCPVGVLSSGILLAKGDHRLFFCLRCFECSVQSVPPQLHGACHSIARQNSRAKFIVIQARESCVWSKDDSSMRQLAQESKNWILQRSYYLFYILF